MFSHSDFNDKFVMLVWKIQSDAMSYKVFVSVVRYVLTWTQAVHDSIVAAFFWMIPQMSIYCHCTDLLLLICFSLLSPLNLFPFRSFLSSCYTSFHWFLMNSFVRPLIAFGKKCRLRSQDLEIGVDKEIFKFCFLRFCKWTSASY